MTIPYTEKTGMQQTTYSYVVKVCLAIETTSMLGRNLSSTKTRVLQEKTRVACYKKPIETGYMKHEQDMST